MSERRAAPFRSAPEAWLLFGLLALFVATGLSVLPLPFTRDQGVYAYGAWRWLEGDIPYRDSFDHKGPALYAVYAVGLRLAGGAAWGPNLLDLLARTVTVWLLWAVGRRLAGSAAGRQPKGPRAAPVPPGGAADTPGAPAANWGLLAAALAALPLFGRFNSVWTNAQAETFMLPLMVASAWLVLRAAPAAGGASGAAAEMAPGARRAAARDAALAGALAAQAALLKPTAALHGLFLLAWLFWARGAAVPRAAAGAGDRAATDAPAPAPGIAWRLPLAFAAGGLAGAAPWFLYLAAHGALGPMWEALVVFNSFHAAVGGEPLGRALRHGFLPIFQILPLLALAVLLPGGGRRDRRPLLFLAGWLAAAALQVIVQRKLFFYHWLALVPPLALCGAAGLRRLGEAWRGRTVARLPAAPAVAAASLLYLLVAHGAHWLWLQDGYRTLRYLQGRFTRDEYWVRFRETGADGKGDFNLMTSARVADLVRERVPPDGRLLVFGFEPIVNWLARRPAPTRFSFDYPLTFTPRSARAARWRERWRDEFLADLRERPPEMVLLVDNDVSPLEPVPSLRQANEWPQFRDWLRASYEQVGTLEDFYVLARRTPGP